MTQPRVHTIDGAVDTAAALGAAVGVLPPDAGAAVGKPDTQASERQAFLEAARAVRSELVVRVATYEQVAIPTWDHRLRATFKPLEDGPRERLADAFARMQKSGNDQQARDWACTLVGEACCGLTLDGVDIGSGIHGGFGPDFAFIVDLPKSADLAALVWAAFNRDQTVFAPFLGRLQTWFADPIPATHQPEVDGPFGAG